MNDFLFNTLVSFPKKLGKKQFDLEELKAEGTLLALFEKKAQQTILDLAYGRFDAYLERFSKIMELTKPVSIDSIQVVAEVKATRDVYIHNNGEATLVYFQKAGNAARVRREKEKLPVGHPYIIKAIELIIAFLKEVFELLPSNYKNLSYRRVFKTMWEHTCLNRRVPFAVAWEVIDEENFFIREKETDYGFSHSEVEVYNMCKDIYLGTNSTDFGFLFRRWGPATKEHQIALSWLQYPFWF